MINSTAPAPMSIRNILLPTDFSSSSEKALAYGACVARRFGATLNIVTVVPEEIVDYVQPPDPFYLRHTAEKKMARLAAEDVLQGVRHRELVKDGSISEIIPSLGDLLHIDLVVVGVHIRSRVKQIVVGSSAEEIIHISPCSVIALGANARALGEPQWRLQRILYATDLHADSGEALAYCLWLGEREHARLTLFHAHKTPAHDAIQEPARNDLLQRMAHLLPEAAAVDTELALEVGDPGDQILRSAEERDVDLIVLGPCNASASWTSTHLPWAVSHKVICHSHCPVLIVHRDSAWKPIVPYS